MSGDAWCHAKHSRTGLVSNQHPDEYDKSEPLNMVSTCASEKCVAKAIKHVAGNTNRQASYFDDAERRARKAATT